MRIILLIMIGLSFLRADFIRDNALDIVIDTSTNLMWQDDSNASTVTKNWSDAITLCENMSLGGYSDWHLPNHYELKSIVDTSVISPASSDVFQNLVSSNYWSSTTYAGVATYAWVVNFSNGYDDFDDKTFTSFVRCVR